MQTHAKVHVFTDFDGTITDTDSLVFLTRELGGGPPLLERIGRELRANTMTLREGIAAEMQTICTPFAEATKLLRSAISVDPTFVPFTRWCRDRRVPLTVLSAGFHEIIELFVPAAAFPEIEILASRLDPQAGGWQCLFRDASDYGHDKARAIEAARAAGARTIFIGDGLSDRASAEVADLVFAKRYLAEYCRERRIPCYEFNTFADVVRLLENFELKGNPAV